MTQSEFELDRIADEFEAAWIAGQRPQVAEFVKRVEPNLEIRLAELLIPLDIEYRSKVGEQVTAEDYRLLSDAYAEIARNAIEEMIAADSQGAHAQANSEQPMGDLKQLFSDQHSARQQMSRPEGLPKASQTFGDYQLLEKLGEGGMGEVWVAQQSQPVKLQVALKLIKKGIGSKEVLARFEIERQSLALMNHPNIARILQAGETADGQPWFAMELVEGKWLTRYCDDNQLSIDERLRLFTDVCSGVQHAHQKGIIHRDLKPSNILVAEIDGKPVPKVIDFGLAKAMEGHHAMLSLATGFGQILGTLKYMSPEQASLGNIDIDTRADIYSLGIILYELLTGSTPLDNPSIRNQAMVKLLEFVREGEPAKPSDILENSNREQIAAITARRATDRSSLNSILTGDLDWIVMKALEKQTSRRYETVSGFASDLRRYLNNEPVLARPPSVVYRVEKFARKHWTLVLAASIVSAILILSTIISLINLGHANRSAQIAEDEKDRALQSKIRAESESEIAKFALYRSQIQQAFTEIGVGSVALGNSKLDMTERRFRSWEHGYLKMLIAKGIVHQKKTHQLMNVYGDETGNFILISFGDGKFKWLSLEGDRESGTFQTESGQVDHVCFSSKESRCAFSVFSKSIEVWDWKSKNPLARLPARNQSTTFVALLDSERLLAVGYHDVVQIWDYAIKKCLREVSLRKNGRLISSFKADSNHLFLVEEEGDFIKLDCTTGKKTTFPHPFRFIHGAFSPDGQLFAGLTSIGTVNVCTTNSWQAIHRFMANPNSISFSPDNSKISFTERDGQTQVIELATGETKQNGALNQCNSGLIFQADNRSFVALTRNGVEEFAFPVQMPLRADIDSTQGLIIAGKWINDRSFFLVNSKGTVYSVEIDQGISINEGVPLIGRNDVHLIWAEFARDRDCLGVVSNKGEFYVGSLVGNQSLELIQSLPAVSQAKMLRSNLALLGCNDGSLILYDYINKKQIWNVQLSKSPIRRIVVDENLARAAALDNLNEIYLVSLEDPSDQASLEKVDSVFSAIEIMPGRQELVATTMDSIYRWDLNSKRLVSIGRNHRFDHCLAPVCHEQRFVTVGAGRLKIWCPEILEPILDFDISQAELGFLLVNDSTHSIVTVDWDGVMRIFQVRDDATNESTEEGSTPELFGHEMYQ